jgi:hypothetical protein
VEKARKRTLKKRLQVRLFKARLLSRHLNRATIALADAMEQAHPGKVHRIAHTQQPHDDRVFSRCAPGWLLNRHGAIPRTYCRERLCAAARRKTVVLCNPRLEKE